ncbi:transporter substrate-binding domain-containing protein [Geomonas limicola]|uniref:transporter substrate-binding domain-containing protein n=1 Tax=Geomonas limicola TaxID=2740186 RepID=UPI001FE5D58A|nr:transporter substrate-binding domain-containing protein [Geomonas limicola]
MAALAAILAVTSQAWCGDLPQVRKSGVLRHLGIPYANFVTGAGDGMDVELMRLFAKHLGVRYEYVKTDWGTVVQDLVGKKVQAKGDEVTILEDTPVKGDLIANGFTVLPWRQKVVLFSNPTFPSQIWLVARVDAKVKPIKPTGNIDRDIARTKMLMKNREVLALKKTCLDPELYNLDATGAKVTCYNGSLNELAPAVIAGEAQMTILDVPDALVALDKWPGKIKILGPVSHKQEMAVAFPKSSPQLRDAFNSFLKQAQRDGSYARIVKQYYPSASAFFPEFFKGK